VLYDCGTQAALAIDIMDRNLYERANDCRWWALNSVFRTELANGSANNNRQKLTDILRTINGLYTVYSNLLIFDHHGQVLAVSNPAYTDLVGEKLQGDWVRQTLGLADTQNYCVSSFTVSKLYDYQPSYIYSAAIRQPINNDPIGGIAIVFDSRPQFQAMLDAAVPRREDGTLVDGAFAVYTERNGKIIASTNINYPIGQFLNVGREFFELEGAEKYTNIVSLDGRYYAVGSCMSAGYREYKGLNDLYRNDIVALVFSALSDTVIEYEQLNVIDNKISDSYHQRQLGENTLEIATFYVGKSWYGIRSSLILESIDIDNIAKIPGVPEFVRGCLIFGDQSITIFDLNGLLHGEYTPSTSKQAIIVTVPNSEIRYGILIDELGEIPEIATSRIEPITALISSLSIAEGLVKPITESSDEAILVILSTERLLQGLPSM
jgi:chemotaxis signal transduction protein